MAKTQRLVFCALSKGVQIMYSSYYYLLLNMTISAIRNRLMSYLAEADDNKIKAVYTLLEKDIEEKHSFILSDEQLQILERERELHLSGQSKSYTKAEALQMIKS